MPFKPFVALSSPVALGAALLGVSASLLALDVTGTVLLDRIRSADAIARATVAAAPAAVASVTSPASSSVASAARQAIVPGTAAPRPHVLAPRPDVLAPRPHALATRPHVLAPRSVVAPPARSRAKPVVGALARRASVVIVAWKTNPSSNPALVVAHPWRATHAVEIERAAAAGRPFVARRVVVALQAPLPPARSDSRSEPPIASLRDVRRFVIRKLRARDHRVCAISATAYNARDGHVVVDLVMRDRHARWSEKAIVRRNGTDLTLLSAKARALPYWTVASSGGVLRP